MKNQIKYFTHTLCLLFILAFSSVNAQEYSYNLVNDLLYRQGNDLTAYMQERCKLDIYYPTDKSGFSTIVWFHGGGLHAGNKSIPETLKNQGMAIVAVNYRLNPKVNCPAYIEDAAAAVAWVFQNIEKYGGDKSKIFVSGHSAGGYLTSMIGLDKSYLKEYEIDANNIAALIPFSGHTITHFTIRNEQGIDGKQVVVDKYAPISHIRKDSPPLMLITGDRDMELLGRYEENAYLWRMMKEIGHEKTTLYELDGFNHGEMDKPAYYLLVKYIKRFEKELGQ